MKSLWNNAFKHYDYSDRSISIDTPIRIQSDIERLVNRAFGPGTGTSIDPLLIDGLGLSLHHLRVFIEELITTDETPDF